MNIVCTICSDLLTAERSSVSTVCGHVFHSDCLDRWFLNNKVCPMDNLKSPSVVKLFFEIDDSKAALNMDQILNDNDEMTKKNKVLESTISAQNLELQESRIKVQQLSDANKTLERNKKADDMALAAFKALKHDSMIDITRLQAEVKILKLDLLAERELRRIYQGKLRDFDPENDDYNPDTIVVNDDNRSETASLGGSGPSMVASDLSVEAKPAVEDPEPAAVSSSEEIPTKLVKSSSETTKLLDTMKFPTKRGAKPYHVKSFVEVSALPTTSGSSDRFRKVSVMPSTSSQAFSFKTPSAPNLKFTNKPVAFGDGPTFSAPLSSLSTGSKLVQATTSSEATGTTSSSSETSTSNNESNPSLPTFSNPFSSNRAKSTTAKASATTSSSCDASTSTDASTPSFPFMTPFSFGRARTDVKGTTSKASAASSSSSNGSTSNSISGQSRPTMPTPAFTFRASSLAKATNTPATATTPSSSGTGTSTIASDPTLFIQPPYSPTNPFWETFDIFRRSQNSGGRPKSACSIAEPKASDR